jgi:hypothetical protein
MGRQKSQIEEVAREIAHVSSALQDLYATLGEYALHHNQTAITDETKSLYNNFITLVHQSDSLQTRITTLRDLHTSILDGNNRVKEIKKEKKTLVNQMNLLYSRIGAIVWEEYYSKVLSEIISNAIPGIKQLYEEYNQLTNTHLIAKEKVQSAHWFTKMPLKVHEKVRKGQLARLQKEHEKAFVEYGEIIARNSLIPLLVSENAMSIEAEYEKACSAIEKKDEELSMVREQMELSRNKLEQEGMGGSLARKIGELESAQKEANKQRKLSAVMYGKSVTTIMSSHKDHEFPKEMDECFEQIIDYQNLKTELLRTTKKLNIEQKIEELVLLLKQDEEHILHIEVQIGQLNQQIEEIHKTMATKKEQIGVLQHQLMKVLPVESKDG